jgi:hypothetical protein
MSDEHTTPAKVSIRRIAGGVLILLAALWIAIPFWWSTGGAGAVMKIEPQPVPFFLITLPVIAIGLFLLRPR